jgi:peptidoglycan DL-endopeptidase RipA
LASRKAGDMIFWSTSSKSPSAIHHVALYIGNNTIIEADRVSVRTSACEASAPTRPG